MGVDDGGEVERGGDRELLCRIQFQTMVIRRREKCVGIEGVEAQACDAKLVRQ